MNDRLLPQLTGLAADRRVLPDRREKWRGGRRDSDWIERPPGALELMANGVTRGWSWRRWLSSSQVPPPLPR
jgi:hypothetical protein